MKYTVIIRQPVADNIRTNLEKQLVERFGLNEQQAQRLASRRAGRLMKPTSQSRAELLLRVFQSVGAQVALEEVREESDAPSQAFSAGLGAGASDDVEMAPPLRNNATMMDFIPPASIFNAPAGSDGSTPKTKTADPFGPGVASFDPFSEFSPVDPKAPINPSELLPDWAKTDPNVPPDRNPAVNLLSSLEAQVASELKASAPAAPVTTAPKPADDWADFAGGLNLPEAAPVADSPRQTTEFLTAVTEDAPVQLGPRTSLTQQIRLGTLLPLGLSSLLTLGLLGLAVPRLQQQLVQANAKTLASAIALNLNTSSQSIANSQLSTTINQSDVGFIQVELPTGNNYDTSTSYLRSKNSAQNDAFNKQVSTWLKSHPNGGSINLGGQNYAVQRVSIIQDDKGQLSVTNEAGGNKGTPVQRIAVGLPTANASAILRNTLLLVLLATLIGLAIASLLANRAAQRIVQPLEELVKVADAISLGDLTRPVKVTRNDEIGDLTQALERMRLSLEAAMDRLRRRKRG